jgi:hypothetical protein
MTKILEELDKQLAQRLLIFRLDRFQLLHHINIANVMIDLKLIRIDFVQARKNRWTHSTLQEMDDHQHQ